VSQRTALALAARPGIAQLVLAGNPIDPLGLIDKPHVLCARAPTRYKSRQPSHFADELDLDLRALPDIPPPGGPHPPRPPTPRELPLPAMPEPRPTINYFPPVREPPFFLPVHRPFYRRAWFLMLVLLAIAGAVVWIKLRR
jgi:hypothetical protein